MAERLLFTALRHPKVVVGAWLLAAVVLLLTAPSLRDVGTLDTAELLPSTSPSVVAAEASRRAFPDDLGRNSAVVIARRPGGLLETDRAWLALTAERLAAHPLAGATRVLSAAANPAMGTALRSPDGAAELLLVELEGSPFEPETAEAIEQLRQVVRADAPAGVDAAVTGIAALGADQGEAITASIDQTAVITILLILLILWWVYRAPLAVLLPLATIAVAFIVSRSLVAFLAASGFTVAGHAETFMVVLVLGAGTDYTLFLVSRYAEELAEGQPLPAALRRTVRVIAGVIAAAAATVIVGFLSMLTADFGMYRSFGPAIALAIAVTLLVGLTFTPALLALTGKAAFWPSGPVKASRVHAASGRWERVASLVCRRPVEVLLAGAILMLVPSAGLAWLTPSMDLVGDLPPAAQSRQGFEILDEHFPAGALAPVQVVVAHDRPLTDDATFSALDALTDRLNDQPGIALARSITQPLGTPLTADTIGRLTGGGFDPRALGLDPDVVDLTPLLQAVEQPGGLRLTWSLLARYPQFNDLLAPFLSDDRQTTRLIVELDGNPFIPESLGELDALPHVVADTLSGTSLAGARVHLAGSPAYYRDVQDVAARDLTLITVVLMLGIFLVLAALLRSLVAPVYLLATVLLSYAATLGLTTWMSMLVLGTADMAFWIPPFLLVILVALGADYNIFIMGRIREEVDAGSDIGAATARGLVLTGGVITSAGLILAGTFAVLMLAPMPNLRLIGFAVTVGVLLDTFVVRSVLVPAATVLLDRWALWPSAHPRIRTLRLAPATIAGLVVLLLAAAALPSLPVDPVVVAHAAVDQQRAPDRQSPADDPSDGLSDPAAAHDSPTEGGVAPSPTTPPQPVPPPPAFAGAPAQPGSPTRLAVPASGGWRYHVQGERRIGAAGSPQRVDEQVLLSVASVGKTGRATDVRLRSESSAGEQEDVRRYHPDRIQLLSTHQGSGALQAQFAPQPPPDVLRVPASPGMTWTANWTSGATTATSTYTVTGERQVTVAGDSHRCVEVTTRTRLQGETSGDSHEVNCWIIELGMTAETRRDATGSRNGIQFELHTTMRLLAPPGD